MDLLEAVIDDENREERSKPVGSQASNAPDYASSFDSHRDQVYSLARLDELM